MQQLNLIFKAIYCGLSFQELKVFEFDKNP